ncbi:MAG TPA: ATP synthase F1 subunit delta [Acidimicrobiia bacterium]|jgi:F-type H+-transporting ATPase subunit delta|nr:ATP synthase F1 subunit delta [Acidimicrobiia bacterium]
MTRDRDRIEAYAHAMLDVARGEGPLADIEDDLFRFARTFESSDDLRVALTDPGLPVERRFSVVDDLMEGKALAASVALTALVITGGHAADLPAIVDRFVELAAAEREREVAEVRTVVPLNAEQQRRLAVALGRATGKQVDVKVVIDPSVLGGIVARVGDVVIDGSVRHRLEQLKEQL